MSPARTSRIVSGGPTRRRNESKPIINLEHLAAQGLCARAPRGVVGLLARRASVAALFGARFPMPRLRSLQRSVDNFYFFLYIMRILLAGPHSTS